MTSDIIWLIIGLLFGAGWGINRHQTPEKLEHPSIDKSQYESEIIYYKKLTKTLSNENTELRKKINEKTI